jgi:16S rRNA processing protein RimM
LFEDEQVFNPGRRVVIADPTGSQEAEIEFLRKQHGRSILKLRGFDTISDVEKLIGREIRIRVREIPEAGSGRFYTFQLKGCRVFTESGDDIGIVTDVLDCGGTEILKVDQNQEETLIPFAASYLKKIDLDERRIVVELPEGLRGFNG